MPDQNFLGWQFFSFSSLNMASHCFLSCIVSGEKLAVNLMEALLYMTSQFLLLSKFFILWQFDYSVSRCGFQSLSYLELVELLELLGFIDSCIFLKFGKFLNIISSNILSAPFLLLLGLLKCIYLLAWWCLLFYFFAPQTSFQWSYLQI